VIAWGAFAFGAVYPWAYWPLFAATAAIGILHLKGDRSAAPVNTAVAGAFAVVAAAVALQLVPLPQAVIAVVSPATDALLRQQDLGYASGLFTWHPLSIDPHSTRIALAAFVSSSLLAVGLARVLGRVNLAALGFGIAAIGLVLAIFGVVQRSTGTLKIYGFWSPVHQPYQIYGPFVNKNHFAGWMLMAIPVTLGLACAGLASAARTTRSDWRSRVLWFASRDANHIVWATICAFAMSVALVLTLSRSGILVFFLTMLMIAALLMRRRAGGHWALRALGVAIVLMLALGVFALTGLEPVARRFATGPGLSGRQFGWFGAIRIARAFPITGSGINTYKTAMLFYSTRAPDGPYWDAAHDDYLQIASEGGLLVGVPLVIAILLVAREIRWRLREDYDNRTYWIRVGAAIGMVGIAVQELVDFSLQIPGNVVLLAVLCAVATHTPGNPRRLRTPVEAARR